MLLNIHCVFKYIISENAVAFAPLSSLILLYIMTPYRKIIGPARAKREGSNNLVSLIFKVFIQLIPRGSHSIINLVSNSLFLTMDLSKIVQG